MANEVKTIFTADPAPLFRTTDIAEARLKSFNTRLSAFGQNPTFGGSAPPSLVTRPVAAELAKANAVLDRFRQDNLRAERELTRQIETEEKTRTRLKIREAKLANDAAIREIRERERAERLSVRRGGSGNEFGEGVAGGLNLPVGAAAIGAIGGALAISFGKASLDATKEASNAQLQLQSITKETGQSYQKLTEQAKKFGEVNLLSNREAQSTFAQIANFANAAGRSDKLEEFRKRFSDLAAAKGINASQLGDISRQLNALTDEATDKLLNANPSAFYDKFAKSIGTTAEKLTDAQKRAAVFDEVLRKGALFDGTAAKRFDDATSATDKLAQKYDNLKESAGKALLPIVELADKAASSFLSVEGAQKNFNSNDPEAVRFNQNFLQNQRVAERIKTLRGQDKLISDAIANPLASSLNSELSKINIADSFFNPENRQKLIEAAKTAAQKTADNFKNSFNAVLSDNKSSLALLKLAQKQFYANQADYDPATRRQLAEGFENSINERAKSDAEKAKAEREKAKSELDKRTEDLKKAADKVRELGKQYNSVFDNLFQKTNSNNLFASVFTEGDKAITDLRKNLAGLAPELRAVAEQMQQKLTDESLFSARLDNKLNALDLRDSAASFRNPVKSKEQIESDTLVEKNRFNEILKRGTTFAQNPGAFIDAQNFSIAADRLKRGEIKEDEFNRIKERTKLREEDTAFFARLNNVSNQNPLGSTFNDLNRQSFIEAFARKLSAKPFDENLSFQERLDRQFNAVKSQFADTPEKRALADRKLISLTQGVDPSKLTSDQRDVAAAAREREAERLDQNESRAREQRQQQIELQTRIAVSNESLIGLAQKGGSEAVVKFIDQTSGGVELPPAATAKDTQKAYDDAYTGGTFYEDSRK